MPVTNSWTSPVAAGTLDLTAGVVVTEAVWDAMVSNFLVLGGTTGKLLQSAIVVGSTVTPTTTAASASLPDMSITMTCQGGDVIAILFGMFQSSVVGVIGGLGITSTSGTGTGVGQIPAPVVNQLSTGLCIMRFVSVATGSVTLQGTWGTNSGTMTAYSTVRAMLAIEMKH